MNHLPPLAIALLVTCAITAGCGDPQTTSTDTRPTDRKEWAEALCDARLDFTGSAGDIQTFYDILVTLDPPPSQDPDTLRFYQSLLDAAGSPTPALAAVSTMAPGQQDFDPDQALQDWIEGRRRSVDISLRTFLTMADIQELRPGLDFQRGPDAPPRRGCEQIQWQTYGPERNVEG